MRKMDGLSQTILVKVICIGTGAEYTARKINRVSTTFDCSRKSFLTASRSQ